MLPCQLFCALKAGDFLMNWLYKEEKWEPWSCFPRAPCWLHWAVLTEILRVLRRVTSSLRGRTENGRASLRMYSIPALHPPSQVTPLILANPLGQAASVRTGQNFTSWLKEKKYICQAQWEGIKIGSWVAVAEDRLPSVRKAPSCRGSTTSVDPDCSCFSPNASLLKLTNELKANESRPQGQGRPVLLGLIQTRTQGLSQFFFQV